jgi:glucose-6-phosphate 1-dehydrogenase
LELKSTIRLNGVCEIAKAGPCGVVVFGASGDLAHKKLFPSLFKLFITGSVPADFFVTGVARTPMDDNAFRVAARKAVMESGMKAAEKELNDFSERLFYITGDYGDDGTYKALKAKTDGLAEKFRTGGNIIFMLAVPPGLYGTISEGIGRNGLADKKNGKYYRRVMVEKPFGRDTESAAAINRQMLEYMAEDQIYRVDHYLGKNTVQNILVFRFANIMFEPVWNARCIDSVQITVSEDAGIEQRAGYFEQAGLIRDIMQNHMLQLLTLVAMEKPAALDAGSVQDEKVKVLKAIKPFDTARLHEAVIRGQYAAGKSRGKDVPAYREEAGVEKNSCVETFFAAKLFIENSRWQGVPFYLKAGKRLDRRATKINILFRDEPDCLFFKEGVDHPGNMLTFDIQPEQGVALKFNAKVPGSKMCISQLDMDFNYRDVFGADTGGDYETVILDCMLGDLTLFWRGDGIEESWKLLTPVLRNWESCSIGEKNKMMFFYAAGSRGPGELDEFIKKDGRVWID